RYESEPRGLDEHRDDEELVRERIEDLAELGGPVEALGEKAVESVGSGSDDEERERRAIVTRMQCREDRPDQRQADQADEVGQVAHDLEVCRGFSPEVDSGTPRTRQRRPRV